MPETLRVAVLWKQLSGYSSACFRALTAAGVDVHLVYRDAVGDAPYDDRHIGAGFSGHHWSVAPDPGRLREEIHSFAPHALLVISWDVGTYRRLARSMRGQALRVLCMDNPWLATRKQWGGVVISRFVIQPTYDIAFLPGDRQAEFARRLGFGDDQILWGFYTCDSDAFAPAAVDSGHLERRGFVFVGRLVPSKGVDVLARA